MIILKAKQEKLQMIEDELLKWRFKHGSKDALRRIYEKYLNHLLTLAMALLNDAGRAEIREGFQARRKSEKLFDNLCDESCQGPNPGEPARPCAAGCSRSYKLELERAGLRD